jgi:integrase
MVRSLTIQLGQYQIVQRKKNYRVQGVAPDARGKAFSLWEIEAGIWRASCGSSTGRLRKRFKAQTLEIAVRNAENLLYGPSPCSNGSDLSVADCFLDWRKSLSCSQETLETDYWPRVRRFVAWCDAKQLRSWSDLRLQHLQEYANCLVKLGNQKRTMELKCRVVSMASRWAANNWPESFRDFTQGFRIPRRGDLNRRIRRDPFTLQDAAEFLLFLRERPNGWGILPGVALGALCSMRMCEFRSLQWADVDLEKGLVHVRGKVKTIQSERLIPVPLLVTDILQEAYKIQSPSRAGSVVLTNRRDSFRQAFNRYRDRWRPGLNLEPNGLRRVLRSEWFRRRWHVDSLAVYRGHKPPDASPVDWNHYIIFDEEGLQTMFREEVVDKVNSILEPFRSRWSRAVGKVIQLPLRRESS